MAGNTTGIYRITLYMYIIARSSNENNTTIKSIREAGNKSR